MMLFLKLSSVKLSFARGEIDKMKPTVWQRELKSLNHFKKMILDIIPNPWNGKILRDAYKHIIYFFKTFFKISRNKKESGNKQML